VVGDKVILARCERVVRVRLEAPLGAANILTEPSQKSSQDGVYISGTLVQAKLRVPVYIMNVTNQDQVLSEGTIIGHEEPALWAANIDKQKPQPRQKQALCKQLKKVTTGARPHVNIREALKLEQLIADYQDVFETKSCDYRCRENIPQD
jgi:hypothetical protein